MDCATIISQEVYEDYHCHKNFLEKSNIWKLDNGLSGFSTTNVLMSTFRVSPPELNYCKWGKFKCSRIFNFRPTLLKNYCSFSFSGHITTHGIHPRPQKSHLTRYINDFEGAICNLEKPSLLVKLLKWKLDVAKQWLKLLLEMVLLNVLQYRNVKVVFKRFSSLGEFKVKWFWQGQCMIKLKCRS